MAKIPFYEDRLSPQGGLNVQARFAEQTTAMDQAMQNLGNAGASAGAILMKIENDNAIANTAKPLAEMPGWGQKTLQDLATKSRDGGYVDMPDGSTVTVTDAFRKAWDDQSTKMLSGITNPAAKEYASKHLASTFQSLNTASIQTEYQLLQQNKSDSFNKSVATMASDVAGNEKILEQRLKDMDELAGRLGFDEHTRNTKLLAGRRSLVESAMQGLIQRNAPEVAEALKQRYGVTEQAAPMRNYANLAPENKSVIEQTAGRLGISASNLAAIISYETGGTFSPSMRGGKGNKHIGLIQFGENEQKAYGANQQQTFAEQMVAVEKYLKDRGVQAGDDLGTLYKIVNGGSRNVSGSASDGNGTIDEHVAKIAADHGGSTKRTSAVPVGPAVQLAVANLDADRIHVFLNEANSQINKQETVYRSQVVSTEQDHIAKATNGDRIDAPMTQQDYVRAYGPVEGAQRFEQYSQIVGMGSDVAAMKVAPLGQQDEIVEKYKPDPSKPGYALAEKRYEAIKAVKDKLNTDRAKDPIAWAQANGMTDQQSIQWAAIEQPEGAAGIAKTLQARVGLAATMREQYGTAPAILNKDEAGKLAAGFSKMSADGKAQFLDLMVKSISDPDALSMVIGQIVPDSPVTGVAAKIYSMSSNMTIKHTFSKDETYNPQVVAKTILKGEALLNPTKADKEQNGKTQNLLMPDQNKMQPQFNSTVQDIFMGQPEAAQVAIQAARAYYAAKSSDEGDYSGELNSKRWKESIDVVLGGVSSINGKNVRRPWGMDEIAFKDQLNAAFVKAIPEYGLGGHATNYGAFNFIARPDDSYIVYNGLGKLKAADGRDVIIRLDGSAPADRPTTVAPTATPNASTTSKALKTK